MEVELWKTFRFSCTGVPVYSYQSQGYHFYLAPTIPPAKEAPVVRRDVDFTVFHTVVLVAMFVDTGRKSV